MYPNARYCRSLIKTNQYIPRYKKKEIPDNVIRVDFQAKKKI